VAYEYNGMALILKVEVNPATWNYAKQNKPVTKGHIECDSSMSKVVKYIDTESRMVASRAWREEGWGGIV
jgi:hypothetical protein